VIPVTCFLSCYEGSFELFFGSVSDLVSLNDIFTPWYFDSNLPRLGSSYKSFAYDLIGLF
jgi:hypothetical protein